LKTSCPRSHSKKERGALPNSREGGEAITQRQGKTGAKERMSKEGGVQKLISHKHFNRKKGGEAWVQRKLKKKSSQKRMGQAKQNKAQYREK